MIKLDPLQDNTLVGVMSESLKVFKNKSLFALFSGDGSINVAQMFDGIIYLTTENNLESGFTKALAAGPFYPEPVI